MSSVFIIGAMPALAALAAFVLMDRTWWWGAIPAALLLLVGWALGVPSLVLAAGFVAVGWLAAVVGTRILADESIVAAYVYGATLVLVLVLWAVLPDGTF